MNVLCAGVTIELISGGSHGGPGHLHSNLDHGVRYCTHLRLMVRANTLERYSSSAGSGVGVGAGGPREIFTHFMSLPAHEVACAA